MLLLATDYSGITPFFWGAIGVCSLFNAGLFLFYYLLVRPSSLPRRFPLMLTLAALAFTIVGPIGIATGASLGNSAGWDVGTLHHRLALASVPGLIGSALLLPFLRRDIRTGGAWLAPLIGIIPMLVFVSILPDTFGGGNFQALSPTLWSIPWHLTCIAVFATAGRRAWIAELRSKAACLKCGYSRQGLATSICPECGGALPS